MYNSKLLGTSDNSIGVKKCIGAMHVMQETVII
jgi:hypothetical protein